MAGINPFEDLSPSYHRIFDNTGHEDLFTKIVYGFIEQLRPSSPGHADCFKYRQFIEASPISHTETHDITM